MNQRKWKGLVCSSTCLFLPLAILPQVNEDGEITTIASWYGPGFHGRKTASGERFNQNALTAASRTLPFGTKVRVRNPKNGKTCTVTINDRGPYVKGRGIDLSRAAAQSLGIGGIARVCYSTVPKYEPKPDLDREEAPNAPGAELEVVAASGMTESVEKPMAVASVQPPAKIETRQEAEPFHEQIASLRSQLRKPETDRVVKAQEPETAMLRASQFIEAPQFSDLLPAAQSGQLRTAPKAKKTPARIVRVAAKPAIVKATAKPLAARPVVAKPVVVRVAAKPLAARPAVAKPVVAKVAAKRVTAKKQTARTIAYSRTAKRNTRAKRAQYIAHRRYKSKFGRSMDKLTARASHLYKGLKGIFAML